MSNRQGKGVIVNRTQLAEWFGVSGPTVDHWVRTGCPVIRRGGKGKSWQFSTADVLAWKMERVREESTGPADTAGKEELNRRKLVAQTEREELSLQKERLEVAPVEDMERAMAMAFAEVKTGVRNVPGRVVSLLIGETDEARFKHVLLTELDQTLEALAETDLLADEDGG